MKFLILVLLFLFSLLTYDYFFLYRVSAGHYTTFAFHDGKCIVLQCSGHDCQSEAMEYWSISSRALPFPLSVAPLLNLFLTGNMFTHSPCGAVFPKLSQRKVGSAVSFLTFKQQLNTGPWLTSFCCFCFQDFGIISTTVLSRKQMKVTSVEARDTSSFTRAGIPTWPSLTRLGNKLIFFLTFF